MKDNFSGKSDQYAKYRPEYPTTLAEYIRSLGSFRVAWDVGTGNGQLARLLAEFIPRIEASDISSNQLLNAAAHPGIHYFKAPSDDSGLPPHSVDLITIAQAIHWFDFDKFYAEVRRVAKPGATIVALGYGLISVDAWTDEMIREFYTDVVGPYWDAERRHVDTQYQSIPFPFAEKPFPGMYIRLNWTLEDLQGYLGTWSAVKHYWKAVGNDPVPALIEKLKSHWPLQDLRPVQFKVFGRTGLVS